MKIVMAFVAAFTLWMLLFWSIELTVIVAGLVTAFVTALALGALVPERMGKIFDLRRVFFFLIYVPYFLYYCLKANLDVMVRVVHPDVPIRPGIVKLRTTLQSPMARTFLANCVTLTPGTLTLDVDGPDMYFHWINIETDDVEKRTAAICGRFEPLLRRIFE